MCSAHVDRGTGHMLGRGYCTATRTGVESSSDGTLVKVFVSGAKVPGSIPRWDKILYTSLFTPLLHLTCGPCAVDDTDLAVSSD